MGGAVIIDRGVAIAAVLVAAALMLLLAVQTVRLEKARTVLASEQRDRASDRAAMAEAAASGIAAARAEEQRTTSAVQEVSHVARLDAARARADGVAAAAVGLRQPAAAFAAGGGRSAPPPGAAAGGEAAAGPGLVLADMLGGVDDTAGELAQAHDLARAAGLACERAYAALTPP
jgi:hypothetical protein